MVRPLTGPGTLCEHQHNDAQVEQLSRCSDLLLDADAARTLQDLTILTQVTASQRQATRDARAPARGPAHSGPPTDSVPALTGCGRRGRAPGPERVAHSAALSPRTQRPGTTRRPFLCQAGWFSEPNPAIIGEGRCTTSFLCEAARTATLLRGKARWHYPPGEVLDRWRKHARRLSPTPPGEERGAQLPRRTW